MADNMVERVSRAIAEEMQEPLNWRSWQPEARAAIEAMRAHLWEVHGFAFTDASDAKGNECG